MLKGYLLANITDVEKRINTADDALDRPAGLDPPTTPPGQERPGVPLGQGNPAFRYRSQRGNRIRTIGPAVRGRCFDAREVDS
jgi:hypothetical protein